MDWLKGIHMLNSIDWLILGDFNLIRREENRNKPGANINEMLLFNEAISHLGIQEIPLHGKKFTWSNMQVSPLLESLIGFSLQKVGLFLILELLSKL